MTGCRLAVLEEVRISCYRLRSVSLPLLSSLSLCPGCLGMAPGHWEGLVPSRDGVGSEVQHRKEEQTGQRPPCAHTPASLKHLSALLASFPALPPQFLTTAPVPPPASHLTGLSQSFMLISTGKTTVPARLDLQPSVPISQP